MLSMLHFLAILLVSFAPDAVSGNWNQGATTDELSEVDAQSYSAMMQSLKIAKERSCNSTVSNHIPLPPPQKHLDLEAKYKTVFKSSEQYAASLHQLAVDYFFNDVSVSEKQAVDLMVRWAEANAHETVLSPFKSKSAARYPTYMVVGSTLVALLLMDQSAYLTVEKKEKIWLWLDHLVEESYVTRELPIGTAGYEDREQRVNNHNLRRAVLLLLYGVHKKNDTYITMSKERFYRSYRAIDDDVLYDSNRGDWALNYFNLGILGFVEYLGFVNLIDKNFIDDELLNTVNKAAQFLIDETIEPVRIHSFAKENVGRPSKKYSGVQHIWWQKRYTGDLVHYAWIDAPFVNVDLKALQPVLKASTPRYSEVAGYIDCLFK